MRNLNAMLNLGCRGRTLVLYWHYRKPPGAGIGPVSRYVRSCKGQVRLQGCDARLSFIRSSRIEEFMKTSSVFVRATLAAVVGLATHTASAADYSGGNTSPTHDSSLSVTAGGVS